MFELSNNERIFSFRLFSLQVLRWNTQWRQLSWRNLQKQKPKLAMKSRIPKSVKKRIARNSFGIDSHSILNCLTFLIYFKVLSTACWTRSTIKMNRCGRLLRRLWYERANVGQTIRLKSFTIFDRKIRNWPNCRCRFCCGKLFTCRQMITSISLHSIFLFAEWLRALYANLVISWANDVWTKWSICVSTKWWKPTSTRRPYRIHAWRHWWRPVECIVPKSWKVCRNNCPRVRLPISWWCIASAVWLRQIYRASCHSCGRHWRRLYRIWEQSNSITWNRRTVSVSGHLSFLNVNMKLNCFSFLPTNTQAIGRIAEAISEHFSNREDFTDATLADENYATELTIAYSVFLQQWLPNREPKVCSEILQALSHIYPLLPHEKILEQAPKVIPLLQSFYRRSMDRNAITQLLASVLKTTIDADCNSLEGQSDSLITNLFDLVCVIPVRNCAKSLSAAGV